MQFLGSNLTNLSGTPHHHRCITIHHSYNFDWHNTNDQNGDPGSANQVRPLEEELVANIRRVRHPFLWSLQIFCLIISLRPIYVNVDSPNLGFPYFLGEGQWKKNTLYIAKSFENLIEFTNHRQCCLGQLVTSPNWAQVCGEFEPRLILKEQTQQQLTRAKL